MKPVNLKGNKKLFIFISIFLLLGALISAFLLYEHFAPSASAFCQFGESFDCGVVNKSPYANLDGFSYLLTIDYNLPLPLINISGINPVLNFLTANAFLSLLVFLFMFLLVWKKYKNQNLFNIDVGIKNEVKWLRGIITFGLAYGFYLIYIQHSLIKMYCLYCLMLDTVMIVLTVTFWMLKE